MKRKNFKQMIAASLAAAMVFTMVAPATPVHAAAGDIHFYFDTLQGKLGNVYNFTSSGTAGAAISAADGAIESGVGTQIWRLPFVKDDGTIDISINSYSKSWGAAGLGLDGYLLDAWYTTRANIPLGVKADQLISPYRPYGEHSYYAALKADPAKKYPLVEKHNVIGGGTTVPAVFRAYAPIQLNVLATHQVSKVAAPGYKLITTGTNAPKVTTSGGREITATAPLTPGDNGNFVFDVNAQNVVGTMTNKPIDVVFNYEPDPNMKFGITVVHEKASASNRDIEPVLREEAVNTNLSTIAHPIVPDANLYNPAPGTSDKKYILQNVVVEKPGTVPTPLDSGDTLVPTMAVNSFDGNMKATGIMPNQPIQIRYIYGLNPLYTQNISVIYKNSDGQTITQAVYDELVADGVAFANDISTSGYGSGGSVPFYNQADESLEYRQTLIPPTTAEAMFKIYAPKLRGYTNDISASTDMTILSQAGFAPHNESNWAENSREYFDGDTGLTPNKSVIYTVTYTRDQGSIAYTNFTASNGVLKIGNDLWDPVAHPEHSIVLDKNVVTPGGTESVANIVIAPNKLPTPVGEDGYDFQGWKWSIPTHAGGAWQDLPAPDGTGTITLPNVTIANSGATVNFEAIFAKNANWSTYQFMSGDPRIDLSNVITPFEVPNRKHDNSPINTTWDEVLVRDNIARLISTTLSATETIKWYDSNMQEMQPGTPMGDGMTYTAYIASNQPTSIYTPVVSPVLDPNTGMAGIQVDTSTDPIQSGLQYVVIGEDGNVVSFVPGTALLANGLITHNINPGYTYTVRTVDPGTPLTVGQPIPVGANASTDSNSVTIPTTPVSSDPNNPIPLVNPDPNNPGQVMITVRPTDDDTTYALRDPNGNIVRPYVNPTGGQVVFNNLDPNVVYEVLASRPGDTSSNLPRHGTPVNTANVIPLRIPHRLSVVLNPGFDLTNVKVSLDGGVTEIEITDPQLQAIAEGTPVLVRVPGLNPLDYNALSGFTKNPSTLATNHPGGNNTILSFTMPYDNVTIQPNYDPIGVVWNNDPTQSTSGDFITYTNDADANNTVVARPNVTDQGIYRLVVTREQQSFDTTNAAQAEETKPYTGLFETSAWVEVYDTATSAWTKYNGQVPDFNLGIKTGAIDPANFDYSLYEIATGSNAVRINNNSTDAMEDIGAYTGEINTMAKNGAVYAFGRVEDASSNVKINSSKNLTAFLKTIRVKAGLTLNEPTYQAELALLQANALAEPAVDAYGITWTYKGISSSETSYVPYNPNEVISSDKILTLFFEGDRQQRSDANRNLQDLVRVAEEFITNNPSHPNIPALRAALDAAKRALHSTPNPARAGQASTTSELVAAFNALRSAYPGSYTPPNSGGGNSGGGNSGGGGSTGRTFASNAKRTLVVGTDGNWELIDSDKHQWIFVLKNGSRVKGWNKLSYTYEGKNRTDWYYFNSDGIMRDGWFYDVQNANWYYLNEKHDGFFGHMTLGWHHDTNDSKWYYLDASSGIMKTGWNNLGGEWYFLNPTAPAPTYRYDENAKKWVYNQSATTKPLGSMYENEVTPDGYNVNASGAWKR